MDDYILETEPSSEDGELPPTQQNLYKIVEDEGLIFYITVYRTEEGFINNEEHCLLYSQFDDNLEDFCIGEHIFYVPESRMGLANISVIEDQIYYYLAVKKAKIAEALDPIFGVNHYSLAVPEELSDEFDVRLDAIDMIKNIWALDMLHDQNYDVWLAYISELEPKVNRFARAIKANPTTPRWSDLLNIAMLQATAQRSDDEIEEMLRGSELAIGQISRPTVIANLKKYREFFAQLPRLTMDLKTDIHTLATQGNKMLILTEAGCQIKIAREVWINSQQEGTQPSQYAITIIPNRAEPDIIH